MIFLAETFSEITYHQLIEDLNQKTECFNHFFYKDVYSFYLNLLFAITQNQDLVLVDTDWSLEEISNYNISPDERIAIENPVKIQSAEELASVIIKSQSTLTLFTSGTTGQPKK